MPTRLSPQYPEHLAEQAKEALKSSCDTEPIQGSADFRDAAAEIRAERAHTASAGACAAHYIQRITDVHMHSVGRAALAVSQSLVLRNWAIGAHIVEFEQSGEDRAKYGAGLLRRLSSDLGAGGIKGVSPDMLERMRLFSRRYPQLADFISAPPVRISTKRPTRPTRSISAPVRKSKTDAPTPLSPDLILRLTWTHLADLVRIDDPWERAASRRGLRT